MAFSYCLRYVNNHHRYVSNRLRYVINYDRYVSNYLRYVNNNDRYVSNCIRYVNNCDRYVSYSFASIVKEFVDNSVLVLVNHVTGR